MCRYKIRKIHEISLKWVFWDIYHVDLKDQWIDPMWQWTLMRNILKVNIKLSNVLAIRSSEYGTSHGILTSYDITGDMFNWLSGTQYEYIWPWIWIPDYQHRRLYGMLTKERVIVINNFTHVPKLNGNHCYKIHCVLCSEIFIDLYNEKWIKFQATYQKFLTENYSDRKICSENLLR